MTLTPAQIWLILGLLGLVSEIFIPGFVICFFGLAGLILSGLMWMMPELSVTLQMVVFSITSGVLLAIFHLLIKRKPSQNADTVKIDDDDIVGAQAVVLQPIHRDIPGRVSFRGSEWSATADSDITEGTTVTITGRNNITLIVRVHQS